MTLNSFSDLILFLACAWIAWQALRMPNQSAGIGLAALLIGLAALLGVFKFSEWTAINESVQGAHRFASLAAAVGAFPILAYCLAYPASPLSMRLAGAAWFTFLLAGAGIAIVVLGFKAWAQIAPAASALWIAWTVFFERKGAMRLLGIAAWTALVSSFAAHLMITANNEYFGFLNKVQILHYMLALAMYLFWRLVGFDKNEPSH